MRDRRRRVGVATVRWHDGLPDLEGLDADTIVGPDGRAYLERYHLTELARFHRFVSDDPQVDLHDHPWDYITVILDGGYREVTPDGAMEYGPPCVLRRRAEDPHRIELLGDSAPTLIATGPVRRRWGFHTDAGWRHWAQYGIGRDARSGSPNA